MCQFYLYTLSTKRKCKFKYLRRKLLSKPCQNQGYILDGYPCTYEQAELLFEDPDNITKDPSHPKYDSLVTPHHLIYLEGSNVLVTHRYKNMLKAQGIALDEVEDYGEPDDTTLNIEEPANLRQSDGQSDEIAKQGVEMRHGQNEEQKKITDLKISWTKPLESPEKRLRRRLERHKLRMAPHVEEVFDSYKNVVFEKDDLNQFELSQWPRKHLPKSALGFTELNVLTYFDLREIFPFVVNMDGDKSQFLYPGGPQKHTFNKLLKRISKSPTGEFVRRMRSVLDEEDGDDKFVEILRQKALALDELNAKVRKEEAHVLNEHERKKWKEWLMLLKEENAQRQMVKSMPRRNYLLKYVLPKICDCLVIYGQRKPADPVDFLAEYLLRDACINQNEVIH